MDAKYSLTCGEDFGMALVVVVGCLAEDRVAVVVVDGLSDDASDEEGGEVITMGFVVVSNFSFTSDSYNDTTTHVTHMALLKQYIWNCLRERLG